MNEQDPLEDAFAPLRGVQPPTRVRNANRDAIENALKQRITSPWWRRSVAVPLPLALATAALLLVSLSIHSFRPPATSDAVAPEMAEEPLRNYDPEPATLVASIEPHVEYIESQRYLSGVGVFDRHVYFGFEE